MNTDEMEALAGRISAVLEPHFVDVEVLKPNLDGTDFEVAFFDPQTDSDVVLTISLA